MNPGQEQQQPQGKKTYTPEEKQAAFNKMIDELPEGYKDEVVQALIMLLNYIHSDEGTTMILDEIQGAKGKEARQIGICSLQVMDKADPKHQWRDPVKVICGYLAVAEISNIAREAGIIDIPQEQEAKIFNEAAQNYLHGLIKSKPTREERESEAIRIQKEVEPMMTTKMRQAAHEVAKDQGIPYDPIDGSQQSQQQGKPQGGGLLE